MSKKSETRVQNDSFFDRNNDKNVLGALLFLFGKLSLLSVPLYTMGITSFEKFVSFAKRMCKFHFATTSPDAIDISGAVTSLIERVLLVFTQQLMPEIKDIYNTLVKKWGREMKELSLLVWDDFVAESFNIYLKMVERQREFTPISKGVFESEVVRKVETYIHNLPVINGVMMRDTKIINDLFFSEDSEISIVSTLITSWKRLCFKYPEGMKTMDMYYDYRLLNNPFAVKEAFYTYFVGEAIHIIMNRQKKITDNGYEQYIVISRILSPKIDNIKTYFSTIIENDIVDRLSRINSTRTAAASYTVGDNEYKLENKEDNEKNTVIVTVNIPSEEVESYKNQLFRLARLSMAQKEIVNYMIETGQRKPQQIARGLGLDQEVSRITTEKSRALKKIQEAYYSKLGTKLNEYYGIKK